MNVQPSQVQLLIAAQMRREAKTGKMSYDATDYSERCSRRWGDWSVMFFRAHNLGAGHWVQLTLTRRTPNLDPVPITPEMEERWLLAFFGEDRPMVRTDLATSDFGRRMGTRHYRLFVDADYKKSRILLKEVNIEPQLDSPAFSELLQGKWLPEDTERQRD